MALRDIEPGEEIFLDYGEEWKRAWEAHVQAWGPRSEDSTGSETYVSAVDFRNEDPNAVFRTIDEQKVNPYPENVVTSCFFQLAKESSDDDDEEEEDFVPEEDDDEDTQVFWWQQEHMGCLRPCAIHNRYESMGRTSYDVEVYAMTNLLAPKSCHIKKKSLLVNRIPTEAIQSADKAYSSDQQLNTSFRHEIGMRLAIFPESWMMVVDDPGDFMEEILAPGQIAQVKWREDGSIISENAYVVGLSPRIRETLLEFCNRMGITEIFRFLTYRGNPLKPSNERNIILGGLNWYVQRPDPHRKSNMHWISPSDENAQRTT